MQLLKIYLWIVKISLVSFGGAYSLWAFLMAESDPDCLSSQVAARNAETNPMSACREDLQKLMGIAEILPGPQVNGIAMTAYSQYGIPGMIVMLLGLITPGLLLVPLLLRLLRQHFALPLVRAFLDGAGVATTAILAYFAFSLIQPAWYQSVYQAIALGSLTLLAAMLSLYYRLNPGLIVILGGTFGYLLL